DDEDDRWLRETVARHWAATGSTVAHRLLADWYKAIESFVKVVPKDYKRVVQATQAAIERGVPPEQAAMAIMTATAATAVAHG
ncbi:MAG TPA: hypothetical protein VFR03_16440, partial [Thermoanaerobaculia bacterium]|nr:hypothetical protein [Thermoanaerobaculia bacterium]